MITAFLTGSSHAGPTASYATLTHVMDSFDVRHAYPSPKSQPRLTFVGITSDWLFRPQDVRAAAERFAARDFDASYHELPSTHGHDAFLAETDALATLLRPLTLDPHSKIKSTRKLGNTSKGTPP